MQNKFNNSFHIFLSNHIFKLLYNIFKLNRSVQHSSNFFPLTYILIYLKRKINKNKGRS